MAGVGRNGGGKVMYCFRENILSRRVTEKESKPLRFTLFFLIRVCWESCLFVRMGTLFDKILVKYSCFHHY